MSALDLSNLIYSNIYSYNIFDRVKKLTPMEIAVKHNQQLLAAFKARKTGKNTSLSASQVDSILKK